MAKYCKMCGNELNGQSRCERCGAIAAEQQTQPIPAYNPQPVGVHRPKGKGGTSVITVLVVILLVVIIALCVAVGMKILLADDDADTVVVDEKIEYIERDEPNPMPIPKPAKRSDEYLFPSHIKLITESDLNKLSRYEVALVRNEIYARHGYIFQTKEYADYFSAQSWYIPSTDFSESMLNETEKYNKDFIVQYETKRGWR